MQFLHTFGGWSPCGSYNTTDPLVIFGLLLIIGVAMSCGGLFLRHRKQTARGLALIILGAMVAGLALYLLLAAPNNVLHNISYCRTVEESQNPTKPVVRSPGPDINEVPQPVDRQKIEAAGGPQYTDSLGRFSIRPPKNWQTQGGSSTERLMNSFGDRAKDYAHLYVQVVADAQPDALATYKHVYILQNGQQAIVTNIDGLDGEVLYAHAPGSNAPYQVWCTYDHYAATSLRDTCETALQSFIPLK